MGRGPQNNDITFPFHLQNADLAISAMVCHIAYKFKVEEFHFSIPMPDIFIARNILC